MAPRSVPRPGESCHAQAAFPAHHARHDFWRGRGRGHVVYRRRSTAKSDGLHRTARRPQHHCRGQRSEQLPGVSRSEEHTSELQSLAYLVCRLLLEKKKKQTTMNLHEQETASDV